jgi:hypothetical protein
MNNVSFEIANNWQDFPELKKGVSWLTAESNELCHVFRAKVLSDSWFVRINDFPDEPMYTLLIGEKETIHFDDWPSFWGEAPPFPE